MVIFFHSNPWPWIPSTWQLPKQSWQQRKMIHHSQLKARYNPITELKIFLKIHPWLQIPYQRNPGKMWRMMLWTSSRRYLFTSSSEAAVDIMGQLGQNMLLLKTDDCKKFSLSMKLTWQKIKTLLWTFILEHIYSLFV